MAHGPLVFFMDEITYNRFLTILITFNSLLTLFFILLTFLDIHAFFISFALFLFHFVSNICTPV